MRPPPFALLETLRVRRGRIPLLDRHVSRFERAREALGFEAPVPSLATLAHSHAGRAEAILRIEVADGRAVLAARAFVERPPPAVITATTLHTPYVHKTTARDSFDAARAEAALAGADDALLLSPQGAVAEGTTWNVFWWEGGRLFTPALEVGVLGGVARARVLELTGGATEGIYPRPSLAGRSLFLTNAVRGVQPIATLDGARVPEDPRTSALVRAFWPSGVDTG